MCKEWYTKKDTLAKDAPDINATQVDPQRSCWNISWWWHQCNFEEYISHHRIYCQPTSKDKKYGPIWGQCTPGLRGTMFWCMLRQADVFCPNSYDSPKGIESINSKHASNEGYYSSTSPVLIGVKPVDYHRDNILGVSYTRSYRWIQGELDRVVQHWEGK